MAYWIKFNFERSEYVLNLESIGAFAFAPNGRLTFWLPGSGTSIILNRQSHPDAYQKVFDYIQRVALCLPSTSWIRINYERNEYLVDLTRITSFVYSANGRLAFCLPDCSASIVLTQQSHPDSYQKILEFIQTTTGHSLP